MPKPNLAHLTETPANKGVPFILSFVMWLLDSATHRSDICTTVISGRFSGLTGFMWMCPIA